MLSNIPREILNILQKLQDADFEAYLVGGCVRDLLLLKKPKDWDITTNAKPEQIQAVFGKSVYENNFGTVAVFTNSEKENLKIVEITPFRVETKYSDKRHPDKVNFTDTLESDLTRRDFTINAMALEPPSKIIDLFSGQEDLKNKIIRTVGEPKERFNEDALRLMRALRFAAELNFKIEEKTEKSIKKYAELLKIISGERIRDELTKIIMAENPGFFIRKMRDLEILKWVLPELEEGFGITQNKHHIYTVFEHNVRALEHAASKNWPLDVRLACLFHDIGKPQAKSGEGSDSTFYSHETIGAKIAGRVLKRLKFPSKMSQKIIKLVRWHLFFSDTEKITLSAVRRIVRNVGAENVWDLMKVRFADRVGMGRPKEEPYRLRKYESMIEEAMRDPVSVKMLSINGDEIMSLTGLKPGVKIGFILNILLEDVLDDSKLNNKEYLNKKVVELSKMSEEELKKIAKSAKQKSANLEELKIREIRKRYFVE